MFGRALLLTGTTHEVSETERVALMCYRIPLAGAVLVASVWGQLWADKDAVAARTVELARVQAMQPLQDTTCCHGLPVLPIGVVGAALILTWQRGYRDANAPGVLTGDRLDQHLPVDAGMGSDREAGQVPPAERDSSA